MLARSNKRVALSSFSYLFSELVQYHQARAATIAELEQRLSDAGYGIGLRVLELERFRERAQRKESSLIAQLQFVHGAVWRYLFGKQGDGLEKSTAAENEYYVYDKEPITNRFVSVPRDMGQLNCAAFVAGIIRGVLNGSEMTCTVTAHFSGEQTVYIIKFDEEAMRRDAATSS
jgi:hypothetical protein